MFSTPLQLLESRVKLLNFVSQHLSTVMGITSQALSSRRVKQSQCNVQILSLHETSDGWNQIREVKRIIQI